MARRMGSVTLLLLQGEWLVLYMLQSPYNHHQLIIHWRWNSGLQASRNWTLKECDQHLLMHLCVSLPISMLLDHVCALHSVKLCVYLRRCVHMQLGVVDACRLILQVHLNSSWICLHCTTSVGICGWLSDPLRGIHSPATYCFVFW